MLHLVVDSRVIRPYMVIMNQVGEVMLHLVVGEGRRIEAYMSMYGNKGDFMVWELMPHTHTPMFLSCSISFSASA